MNKRLFVLIAGMVMAIVAPLSWAAGGQGPALAPAPVDVSDQLSLQRGVRLFANYCLSCHAADYMRYNRVARDLGLTDEQVLDNLVFTDAKVGDTMTVAMPMDQASRWFGKAPPDLSVIARARGADWLYAYLRGFYLDPSRPMGVNNLYFKDVGMPHVLWELQGWQAAKFENVEDEHGHVTRVFKGFELVEPGSMTPKEYDRAVRDLVNFLVYVGEPSALQRRELAPYVIAFLILFTILAYLLKKEYWRDVH